MGFKKGNHERKNLISSPFVKSFQCACTLEYYSSKSLPGKLYDVLIVAGNSML